jgi:ubiquinol-cytochrome c reductase cytochrome b subunit
MFYKTLFILFFIFMIYFFFNLNFLRKKNFFYYFYFYFFILLFLFVNPKNTFIFFKKTYSLFGRIFIFIKNQIMNYPVPISLTFSYTFGSLAFLFLILQIVTGLLLSLYYVPDINYAFDSVQYIMNDVNFGWFFRYLHAIGASFFFLVIYLHIGKSIYYNSYTYPRANVWRIGVFIYILVMATAFLGYVLPWGQMSYWAATVITNLFTVIPYIGKDITYLIWGGEAIGNPTLKRFFILHFILPFIILGFVGLHLLFLHKVGSNTPVSIDNPKKIRFYPYIVLKDIFVFCILLFFFFICWKNPDWFIHPDNNIEANPLQTPKHIVPEWYFLPFYAMLRAIPNKTGGVLVLFFSIFILFFLPNLADSEIIKSTKFKPFYNLGFVFFISSFIILGWLGAQPICFPFIELSRVFTFIYFFYLLIFIPVYNYIENSIIISKFINEMKDDLYMNKSVYICEDNMNSKIEDKSDDSDLEINQNGNSDSNKQRFFKKKLYMKGSSYGNLSYFVLLNKQFNNKDISKDYLKMYDKVFPDENIIPKEENSVLKKDENIENNSL